MSNIESLHIIQLLEKVAGILGWEFIILFRVP